MRTLRDVVASGTEEVVLQPDFFAYIEDGQRLVKVKVQAILENTAVVYQPGSVDMKTVVNLNRILVIEDEIKWVPQNPTKLRELQSRRTGSKLGGFGVGAKS